MVARFSRCFIAILFVGLTFCGVAQAAGLPDTGQTLCYNGSFMTICDGSNTGDSAPYPGQDARFGRDAAAMAGMLSKIGGGAAGFDYTKVCNSGELAGQGGCPVAPSLGSGANDWACTKDNITGLIWEVKTDDNGLRDRDWTYSWYNADSSTNGGDAGLADGGENCFDVVRCDTEKYVTDVNTLNICGEAGNDWRLPSIRELMTLVEFDTGYPAIDGSYFPHATQSYYWTASSSVFKPNEAISVYFGNGSDVRREKIWYNFDFVRVVRGGEF